METVQGSLTILNPHATDAKVRRWKIIDTLAKKGTWASASTPVQSVNPSVHGWTVLITGTAQNQLN